MSEPKFSIDAMCSILKRQGIESSEYTDCTILYQASFEQLRNLYTDGFETGELNVESLRQQLAEAKEQAASAQAQVVKMREALAAIGDGWARPTKKLEKCVHDFYGYESCEECYMQYAEAALKAIPHTDTSALDAIRADDREAAAKLCEQVHKDYAEHPEMALTCAAAIRALAAKPAQEIPAFLRKVEG